MIIAIPNTNLILNRKNLKCHIFSHGIWKWLKRCRHCGGKLITDKELPYEYDMGVKWNNFVCIKCSNGSTKKSKEQS